MIQIVKRYVVAVDLDDCMNNLMDVTIQKYEEYTGVPFPWAQVTCFDLSRCLSREEIDVVHSIWADLETWKCLQPQPKSQMAIKGIQSDGCNVYIATATDLLNACAKEEWLAKYFPFIPKDNFIIIQDKTLLNCDFIIDDKIELLERCSPAIYRICVDKPWNQRSKDHDEVHGIHRVKNLEEARYYINRMIEEENKN